MHERAIAFDAEAAWRLHAHVAVRRESFGALLYHFDTRRLSFLPDHHMVDLLERLTTEPSARAACRAAGVSETALPRYEDALSRLAAADMLVPGTGAG